MAIDMFLDLPEIPGESQKQDHEGQWDILSWSIGVVQQGSFDVGGKGGGSGKAEFQDVSIVKYVDKATPVILKSCGSGKHFDKATIYVRKAGENPMEYLKVELEHLIISSVQNSGAAAGDLPMESLTMNCAKVTLYYTEQQEDGSKGAQTQGGFDIRVGAEV
jgi:type VI secretion system secreted protein Hcp